MEFVKGLANDGILSPIYWRAANHVLRLWQGGPSSWLVTLPLGETLAVIFLAVFITVTSSKDEVVSWLDFPSNQVFYESFGLCQGLSPDPIQSLNVSSGSALLDLKYRDGRLQGDDVWI